MEFWIIIALVLVAAAVALAVGSSLDRQRTDAIQRLASNLGFQYQPEPKLYLPSQLWQLELFSKGRNRRVNNLIQGRMGNTKVSLCDYRYTSRSGKSSRTYRQTVVVIEADDLQLPSFMLIPENVFHKIGDMFGYHDIDFATHPDFSSRYLLKGSDESWIRQVFHDDVLKFYQHQAHVSTEGIGSVLIYYRAHQRLAPDQWKAFMDEALTGYRHLATEGYS
jgi:hypothetical protein